MYSYKDTNELNALSPLDGRYASKTFPLRTYFSEAALIKYRIQVEIAWLLSLSKAQLTDFPKLTQEQQQSIQNIVSELQPKDIEEVKHFEKTTNHDVKAVEYFIKKRLSELGLSQISEFVHFACTSEDINNVSYALMIQEAQKEIIEPKLQQILKHLKKMAHQWADQPMLCRTHGQPATPSTMGKEIANVAHRLEQGLSYVQSVVALAKLNGATGNYNAHQVCYPDFDWPTHSQNLLKHLGLTQQPYTTQIEPHDWLAQLFGTLTHINTILIDLNRDLWGYISIGYFKQKVKQGEVGSSTMPHKVNPIDFENSEGNLGLANAILSHMAQKLPISRWQRDLSDSTVLRNVGVGFGYLLLALESLEKGLGKLELNPEKINHELDHCWEILAEPVQMVMRRYQLPEPYEQLKALTRGQHITQASLHQFIQGLTLPEETKQALLALTPRTYIGLSSMLAKEI